MLIFRGYSDGLADADGLMEADGLIEADGLMDADMEVDGLSEADGLTDAPPAIYVVCPASLLPSVPMAHPPPGG